MFHGIDIDAWTRVAGAAWVILVGFFTLLLSLLALLLPFFVWRILHWSRMSAQELTHLNTRMEHLLIGLSSGRGSADESDEFIFSTAAQPGGGNRKNLRRRGRSSRRKTVISRPSRRSARLSR